MSNERRDYERDWAWCRRCRCYRPIRELEREGAGVLICRDRAWCDRVILVQDEMKAVEAEAQSRALAVDELDAPPEPPKRAARRPKRK